MEAVLGHLTARRPSLPGDRRAREPEDGGGRVVAPQASSGWERLPADLLEPILDLASTPASPGMCAAAGVCRHWRAVAQTRMQRQAVQLSLGSLKRAQSFAAWLQRHAGALHELDVSPFMLLRAAEQSALRVTHKALATAATAALEAGAPLPLQRLLLYDHTTPLDHVQQLLAALPNLQHLVLDTHPCPCSPKAASGRGAAAAATALCVLRDCTALTSLQLTTAHGAFDAVHARLPASLLDLQAVVVGTRCLAAFGPLHGLSRLTALTRLQLSTAGKFRDPRPFLALPSLAAVELTCNGLSPSMAQLRRVLVSLSVPYVAFDFLSCLTALTSLSTGWGGAELVAANLVPALPCLTALASASFRLSAAPPGAPPRIAAHVLAACQDLAALRELDIVTPPHLDCSALSLLSQVTGLSLHVSAPRAKDPGGGWWQWLGRRAGPAAALLMGRAAPRRGARGAPPPWCSAVSRLPQLRWLGVQAAVLLDPEAGGWLGALTSLTALTLRPWGDTARLCCAHELAGGGEGLRALLRQLEGAAPSMQLLMLETWGRCLPLDGTRVLRQVRAALPGCDCGFYRCLERLRAAAV